MRSITKYFYIFMLFFTVSPAVTAQTISPPPLEAYGRLPDIERMTLSVDGTRIGTVMSISGERVVVLMTSELEALRFMRLGEAKVRNIEWAGNDHLVVTISRTEQLGPEYTASQFEFWHAFILPADPAMSETMVFDRDATMMNSVFGEFGIRNLDGKWLVHYGGIERERRVRNYYIGKGRPALFAVDTVNGRKSRIAPAASQGQSGSWLLGPDGKVAATISLDVSKGSWQIKVPYGPVLAEGNTPKGDVSLVSLGKDGTTVIYGEFDEAEQRRILYEVPLDGKGRKTRFAAAEAIDRLFTDRLTGRLLGIERTGERTKPEFYDPQHQSAANRIQQTFAGLDTRLIDWTPDFSRVLVRTSGNGDSGTWYLVDLQQTKAVALGYEREAIEPGHVGNISTVEYSADDGTLIDGILTLPPGREPAKLPLVMLPHGGPHAHDEEVFDWWAQAFASRGYAVFQPNFRGSTNRDEAFVRAGFGQWGKAMQTDISDAIAELAGRGIVDPARACIVGASYGGYAALAGVTLQQGVYRCSVAIAPVSDLGTLFSDEYHSGGMATLLRRSLLEELGPRSGFEAVSPRRHADKADAPILLIHGKNDTVVPFSQTQNMADALKNARKPHRLVILREEDHWLSRAATRLQMLEEAVAFVQEHNPAD